MFIKMKSTIFNKKSKKQAARIGGIWGGRQWNHQRLQPCAPGLNPIYNNYAVFKLYSSSYVFVIWVEMCEDNENKQKEARIRPF